jgi:hypothetical protein
MSRSFHWKECRGRGSNGYRRPVLLVPLVLRSVPLLPFSLAASGPYLPYAATRFLAFGGPRFTRAGRVVKELAN